MQIKAVDYIHKKETTSDFSEVVYLVVLQGFEP